MRSDAAWRAMQDAKRGPSCRDFNGRVPIGTPVRYWTGPRTGPGVESKTRTEAQLLGGHTPVVWVEGCVACIALSHVEVIR